MPLIECSSSALNDDAFPLTFTTEEGLSRLSHFSLDIEDAQADLDLDAMLGKPISVAIDLPHGGKKHFHGYITGVGDQGQRHQKFVYRIQIHGWPWFLEHNQNSRIFQGKSALEIIEQVFADYDVARFRFDVQRSVAPREYCVQFNETDLNFVSRLLEDEGLHYRFEHAGEQHTLVMSDLAAFDALASPYHELCFIADGNQHQVIREGIHAIDRSRQMVSQEAVVSDYDYHNPSRNLCANAAATARTAGMRMEWFDYATGHDDASRGEELARQRIEAWSAQARMYRGRASVMGMHPGGRFALSLHPDPARNRSFNLIEVSYRFIQDGPDSAAVGRDASCTFSALEHDVSYRPRRVAVRPSVAGMHSATVVGPAGADVHTDASSRVRVHFHWDRYRSTEEDSSCWIRVAQTWAGKGWGMLALPRVGQEVLVTYLDGDLDRPVVTGAVYNGENPPPYDLPSQANYTGIVSRSFKEGTPGNASQLTFDDARGKERVMLHAERDMEHSVERNESVAVGQDRTTDIAETDTKTSKSNITYTESSASVTGTSVSSTGSSLSSTGSSISATGSSIGFTGSSIGFTGSSVGFTGVGTSFTGVGVGFVGIGAYFTGVATNVTGVSASVTGMSTSATGVSTSVTGTSTSATGTSISTTGVSISTTGVSMSETGQTIKLSSLKASTAGTETKTRGMQSKN